MQDRRHTPQARLKSGNTLDSVRSPVGQRGCESRRRGLAPRAASCPPAPPSAHGGLCRLPGGTPAHHITTFSPTACCAGDTMAESWPAPPGVPLPPAAGACAPGLCTRLLLRALCTRRRSGFWVLVSDQNGQRPAVTYMEIQATLLEELLSNPAVL